MTVADKRKPPGKKITKALLKVILFFLGVVSFYSAGSVGSPCLDMLQMHAMITLNFYKLLQQNFAFKPS